MAKALLIPVFLVLATPCLAGVPQRAMPDQNTLRAHGEYWLSRDLNRLVFWQAPAQSSARR